MRGLLARGVIHVCMYMHKAFKLRKFKLQSGILMNFACPNPTHRHLKLFTPPLLHIHPHASHPNSKGVISLSRSKHHSFRSFRISPIWKRLSSGSDSLHRPIILIPTLVLPDIPQILLQMTVEPAKQLFILNLISLS